MRKTGRVKWYNEAQGYGFITPEDGEAELFVHHTALQGFTSLAEGEWVEFDAVYSNKGPAANNVVKLEA